jgi:inorganic pyrophosphatase
MQDLTPGKDAPHNVNVVIEIRRGERNKYEMDKDTGLLVLDRVNATALGYPLDYGYVPQTLCEDGDPLDALLVIDESVPHGVVVPCRPIGVLHMIDDGDADDKLIVVPTDDITKEDIHDVNDLGEHFKRVVEHFYRHYKDWKNDWKGASVAFEGWGGAERAREVVEASMKRHKTEK